MSTAQTWTSRAMPRWPGSALPWAGWWQASRNSTVHARQLSLTSYEPVLGLENLVTGIDNVRHDVFLSPKLCEVARLHIFKLIAKHGNVEDLAAAEVSPVSPGNAQTRARGHRTQAPKPFDQSDFKRQLAEL